VRFFVVSRHAHSQLNLERRVNGDPAVDVPLTDLGRAQARKLGEQLANLPVEACVHTRFPRTRVTAELALEGRDVPFEEEPLLDDVRVGDLEGVPLDEYRKVKSELGRSRPFPGGESLDDAAARYAAGYRRLLESERRCVLVIGHEIALRYALNAAAGSNRLDGPPFHDLENARPFVFGEDALSRAVARIAQLAGAP
jgi:broad specificity phosphatase PhoE